MPVKILCVAGARPNFIKVAPLMRAFRAMPGWVPLLVHTGQHYDDKLSRIFFKELGIANPDIWLEVGSASHASQTAEIMRRFEPVLDSEQPEAVVVVGDVNSTLACALVTAKFLLRQAFTWRGETRRRPVLIHVEAGLRSFDETMPEEVNRRLTDALCDVLLVSEPAGVANLRREGVADDRVFLVGNVMIDTLKAMKGKADSSPVLHELGIAEKSYGVLTLHRPSNVDEPARLVALLSVLDQLARTLPLVFPAHPRTRQRLDAAGFTFDSDRWRVIQPLGYLDFLRLESRARVVFTDSGGVQEETTVLGVPCITLRDSTERPITVEEGTNILAGTDRSIIAAAFETALAGGRAAKLPHYWDGLAAERAQAILAELFRLRP
jgi:UDP-N-acetylglucosamine 2-epimerase (non-hydrolysing)